MHDALASLVEAHYGLAGACHALPGYEDLNAQLTTPDGTRYIVKLHTQGADADVLHAQMTVLDQLQTHASRPAAYPQPVAGRTGAVLHTVALPDGRTALLRLLTFLEGTFWAEANPGRTHYRDLGRLLAETHLTLAEGVPLAIRARALSWDLQRASLLLADLDALPDPVHRRLVHHVLAQFEAEALPVWATLPRQTIHNDANDWNVLVDDQRVVGLIDFGDAVFGPRIQDLAVALAYVLMGHAAPLAAAADVLAGYAAVAPMEARALDTLYYAIGARLAMSVLHAAKAKQRRPDDAYLAVSEAGAWALLDDWLALNPMAAQHAFREAAGVAPPVRTATATLLERRARHFSAAMSLSYRPQPIRMTRAAMQYMYDDTGRTYLDGVNNIMHVGHAHPAVVAAARQQLGRLNTNTRYLYDELTDYAGRLLALFPEDLDRVFFVNSGSAAADLALRLAQTATGRRRMLVMQHGYHGNTAASIALSSYKYDGKGGPGAPDWISEVAMPDPLRDTHTVAEHLATVDALLAEGPPPAGFIAESILGCGGQVVLPDGFLRGVHARIRAHGGVCIADEVQTGFGRIGTHQWAYEPHGVMPDVVVLGKPMGNGHPMGAVVTTTAIADAFANGMEFFSSFGGNPVSCAIGLAVLDVLENEHLQTHALDVGTRLKADLHALASHHERLADVRGSGFFLGIECVTDRHTMASDARFAEHLVQQMKARGILLSTDGPHHNVIKFKPPMVFTQANADRLVRELAAVLEAAPST
ncbi:MAG: aminotransferase class III-fold pyridoxal phosphate-dependent enzyme [Myxococcota bacterium]